MKNPDQFIYAQVCDNGVKNYLKLDDQFFFYRSKFSQDFPNHCTVKLGNKELFGYPKIVP